MRLTRIHRATSNRASMGGSSSGSGETMVPGMETEQPDPRRQQQDKKENEQGGNSKAVDVWFEEGCVNASYQRNNKDSGQKNLRCFPQCDPERGHIKNGWCGSSISLAVRTSPAGPNIRDLFAWAEFELAAAEPRFPIGHRVSLREVRSGLERRRKEAGKPWIVGTRFARGFDFNTSLTGWHYGWTSNVHTCDSFHVLRALVFQRCADDENMIVCVATATTPAFQIYCSRRRQRSRKAAADAARASSAASSSTSLLTGSSAGVEQQHKEKHKQDLATSQEMPKSQELQKPSRVGKRRRSSDSVDVSPLAFPPGLKRYRSSASSASSTSRSVAPGFTPPPPIALMKTASLPALLASSASLQSLSSSSSSTASALGVSQPTTTTATTTGSTSNTTRMPLGPLATVLSATALQQPWHEMAPGGLSSPPAHLVAMQAALRHGIPFLQSPEPLNSTSTTATLEDTDQLPSHAVPGTLSMSNSLLSALLLQSHQHQHQHQQQHQQQQQQPKLLVSPMVPSPAAVVSMPPSPSPFGAPLSKAQQQQKQQQQQQQQQQQPPQSQTRPQPNAKKQPPKDSSPINLLLQHL